MLALLGLTWPMAWLIITASAAHDDAHGKPWARPKSRYRPDNDLSVGVQVFLLGLVWPAVIVYWLLHKPFQLAWTAGASLGNRQVQRALEAKERETVADEFMTEVERSLAPPPVPYLFGRRTREQDE